MAVDFFKDGFSLGEAIVAVGALGTAAYGLVDVTKCFGGGISLAGYGHILRALRPFHPALDAATGSGKWIGLLKAHWLNGRSLDEQKSTAKALVRLGLTHGTALAMAEAGKVNGEGLAEVADKLSSGKALTDEDLNILGRFDAALDMDLEAAFDRADQQYRNSAKTLAAGIAVALAWIANYFIDRATGAMPDLNNYLLATLVGVLAVPLAPVAKDLANGLSAAVKAVQAARKV